MGNFLESLAVEALSLVIGADEVNEFLINRIVNVARNRPHPWSTKNDYISWSGLTDRTYNARLLRAKPYPDAEATGTRRPPIADVVALFQPEAGGQRLCPKSTLLFPAFAQYLTDGFLRTQTFNDPPYGPGGEDRRRTTSNHEIDMSPLYGRTPAQTAVLRDADDTPGRRGRLKTQIIDGEEFPPSLYDMQGKVHAEFCDAGGTCVLDQPLGVGKLPPGAPQWQYLFAVGGDRANASPQVAMMNTLWLREHNRLAGMLDDLHPDWDGERVFETARNIVIVMFIKIVVEEYINHINTSVFRLRADPRCAWKADWNRPNWMTTEFSLLYRWHSLVPQQIEWGGKMWNGDALLLNNVPLVENGLARSFADVSGNRATQLGLHNSATFVQMPELKAVEQARTNQVATYNDYRRALELDPATSFRELVGECEDADEQARRDALARELQTLYGDVENVEFYIGLFAEPVNENGPLPELVMAMVAMDAFSQALTNPLLSEHIYGDADNRLLAFTAEGLAQITSTRTLRDILVRNAGGVGDRFVGMTRPDWHRR